MQDYSRLAENLRRHPLDETPANAGGGSMSWGGEQDNLLWEMREFLKEHSIYELLDLVRMVVEERECGE